MLFGILYFLSLSSLNPIMSELEEVKKLISSGKYCHATKILDGLLRKNKDNAEVWYLRGLISLKSRNYEYAHECLLRAILLNKKAEYYRIKGMAHMEMFELPDAIANFESALRLDRKDAAVHFFIAVCLLLLGDLRSEIYFRNAWQLNKRRTKELMKNFYDTILRPDVSVNKKLKDEIEKELGRLP